MSSEGRSRRTPPNEPRDDDDDVIVIPRSWLIAAGVGVGALVLGGLIGYLMALFAFNRGVDQAVAALAEQIGAAEQQPSPTNEISADDDPFLGPKNAPVTIIEFSDFRCGYCKRFRDETLDALFDEYGDQIRFVYRDFPAVGGTQAAQAAECAHEQDAFWEYHDGLFLDTGAYSTIDDYVALAGQVGNIDTDQFRECLETGKYSSEVDDDASDARSYGVSGTPTFFINGVRLIGAQPLSAFQQIIDEELKK
jgi:protein-disulfide isomerase